MAPSTKNLHLDPVSLVLVKDGIASSCGTRHAQSLAELGLASKQLKLASLFRLAELPSEDYGL